MHTHTKYTIAVYERLLTDIYDTLRMPYGTPDVAYDEWLSYEGPLLDKEVLKYLEGKRDSNILFPNWLKPIWERFIQTDDAQVLRQLRQLLVFCYKIEQEPSNEQLQSAQAGFEEVDSMVGTWTQCFDSTDVRFTYLREARRIVGSVTYRIDWSEVIPSHGPGGTFPARLPCEKSNFRTLYTTIQEHYPFDQYYCGLPNYWDEVMVKEEHGKITELEHIVANLVAVPKDSRGPRLICVHPAEAIWIQQGKRRLLEQAISNSPHGKFIQFTDQTVNGKIALSSSISREYCTLDLKEASDRISPSLVRYLFGDYTYEKISCSRATDIKLLDGRVIRLEKWAPMGNCLTFPVESLIFYALVRASIVSHCGYKDRSDVYVFGDDIIFPSRHYDCVIRGLISVGLVPNADKTFRNGFFRESCGVDAYRGTDVTPLRMRQGDVSSLEGLVSNLSLALRLRLGGYYACSAYIYKMARRALKDRGVFLPYDNRVNAPGLFEYVDTSVQGLRELGTKVRKNRNTQTMQIKSLLVSGQCKKPVECGWYHIQDSLLRLAQLREVCSDRRTEYPIPYRIRSQYGWTDCS